MKKLIVFLFVFLTSLSMQAQRCAVLEFKARVGISQADVDGISGMFITYFKPAGYTMVERTQIDKIIEEQGFQRSTLTERQMVRIGELLNVSKIVVGDVNVLMGYYNVDARVINVESGTVAATEGATFASGTLYRSTMQKLAQNLASKIAITASGRPTGAATSSGSASSASSTTPAKRKRTAVETLYGYLKIFPNELGVFQGEPVNVIRQINAQAQRGYNNWRIPTEEELSLLRANGYLGSGKYMTKESKTGIVLLVSDGESYITIREQERQQEQQRDFVETASGLNMKMVYVEGGNFLMGATAEQGSDGKSDEQVIRRVRIDSYYIGECEVTQAQWTKVMGTSVEQQRDKADANWHLYGVGPDYPMYYVSWEEATEYCRELSRMTGRTYRLPTEAQWEYAARGGKKADGTKYSGGPIDAVAWYSGNSGGGTHPVKNKRPNGLGLYDMSGNVWEWCLDWYSNKYNVNDTTNPTGPSSGSVRVLRGGSWLYAARSCRVSDRLYNSPSFSDYLMGFRVVVIP